MEYIIATCNSQLIDTKDQSSITSTHFGGTAVEDWAQQEFTLLKA